MNTISKAVSGIFAVSMLVLPSLAHAQEVSVRLEPGVAVPVTSPQDQRFNVGAAGSVKLGVNLTPFLDVGPSVGVVALPDTDNFSQLGTSWILGGGLRLKRPHDLSNTGHGFSALSPWVDTDLQYVRTGELNRVGWDVAVGAAVPTSDSRRLWVGPFVRYQNIFSGARVSFDTRDAGILIAGLSLELGASYKKPAPVVLPPPAPVLPPKPLLLAPPPAPTTTEVRVVVEEVIQFKVDSAALDTDAMSRLDHAAAVLDHHKHDNVQVNGHASSDGPLEYNKKLATARAQAVVDYLVSKGMDRATLTAQGFGISVPVASNKTKAGRVLNRRAEFKVSFVVVQENK